MTGFFITFEGSEGVGKSTQIKHLESALKSQEHDVVVTREPGGTPRAEKIRALLSHPDTGGKWTEEAELLLLFAARAEHIQDVIKPALKANKIIICDRYIDSTRVYQGHLGGLSFDLIYDLEKNIVEGTMPHLTFVLDMPVEEAMKRVHARGVKDHYDQGDEKFYQTLRDGFLKIATLEKRCKVIDAMQNEQDIATQILNQVKEHLHEHV